MQTAIEHLGSSPQHTQNQEDAYEWRQVGNALEDRNEDQTANTNWDQGILTLSQLKSLLTLILRNERVLGIDVCGECSTTIHQLAADPAIRLDNEANYELLTLMRKYLQQTR